MKVLVTGGGGQLGLELSRMTEVSTVTLARHELDVTSRQSIDRALEEHSPDAVINCAAYTKVDLAEDEKSACHEVNAVGVGNLAAACDDRGARLVHISTDYVFGQEVAAPEPWQEGDEPEARGVYASSKRQGELRALERCADVCVVRTCGLYDRVAEVRTANFVKTMLRLGGERNVVQVVADQTCTPTFVGDLAPALCFLAAHEVQGIVHVTNTGATTWCDFARAIFELAEFSTSVEAITTEQFGARAPRPHYSVLSTELYDALGGPTMRPWRSALKAALAGS